jgi:hypothetical protein
MPDNTTKDPFKIIDSLAPNPPYGVKHVKAASASLESGPYPSGSSRSDWLKEDITKLDAKKVDKEVFETREETNTEKFRIIEDKVATLKGCSRHEEFEDMKRAIDGWRNFFRNTVAVGAISGLFVIGGWMWQYYTLTSAVADTGDAVQTIQKEVKEVKSELQAHRELSLERDLGQQKDIDSRFSQMEYRLMVAISRLSHGQPLDQPSPDAYLQERKKQLVKMYGSMDQVPANVSAQLKDEVKDLTPNQSIQVRP